MYPSIPNPPPSTSQFDRLTHLTQNIPALATAWSNSKKTRKVASNLHFRARKLHRDHNDCYQRCLTSSTKPSWWEENTPALQRDINRSIAQLERELKYATYAKKWFPIPEVVGRGEPGWPTKLEEQEWRRAIWLDQHAKKTDLPRWFMDSTKTLNSSFKILVQCWGPLIQWEVDMAKDLKRVPKGSQAAKDYETFFLKDGKLVGELDNFVYEMEDRDVAEYDACYEPWVGDMLEKLVGRYREGLRLHRAMGLETGL